MARYCCHSAFCLLTGAQAGGSRRGWLHRGYCVPVGHPAGPGPHSSRYRRSALLKLLSVPGLLSLHTPTHTQPPRYHPYATLALSSTGLLHCCHCDLLLCWSESMRVYILSFIQCDPNQGNFFFFGCKFVCVHAHVDG